MPKNWSFFGLIGLILAISAGLLTPAAAEFFGCHDRQGQVLAVYGGGSGGGRYSHVFAQQPRPHIIIHPRHYPGRYATRQCRSWLAKEYRVSGPVIVPQMRCWWN
jgi:hypothetical protein